MTENYVALLGTKGGPAIRPGSSMPVSNLFCLGGQKLVVDCGLGVTRGLVDQGFDLKTLSRIFITHLHSDHYVELGPLLHTAWTAGLRRRVAIHGPRGLDRYWEGFVASMQADIDLRIADEGRPDLRDLVTIHEIDAGRVLDADGLRVTAIRTVHPPLVDCFALAFEAGGFRVVFSGDTAPMPEMVDFAQGADLLIHEAMLTEALPALMQRIGGKTDGILAHILRSHSAAGDVADIATTAGVGALALTHLLPADDPTFTEADWRQAIAGRWAGPFFLGRDGLRIDLPIRG